MAFPRTKAEHECGDYMGSSNYTWALNVSVYVCAICMCILKKKPHTLALLIVCLQQIGVTQQSETADQPKVRLRTR